MKKYKHKETGTVIQYKSVGCYVIEDWGSLSPINNSISLNFNFYNGDWEEVKEDSLKVDITWKLYTPKEEPNYLITAFRRPINDAIIKIRQGGLYSTDQGVELANSYGHSYQEVFKNASFFLNHDDYEIYSVKNSKGLEWSLGDKYTMRSGDLVRELKAFRIFQDKIVIDHEKGFCELDWIDKVKNPIYTTTDGKEIYEGDYVGFYLLDELTIPTIKQPIIVYNFKKEDADVASKYLTFTSEENRDKYIKENTKKPIFVSADGKEMFEGYRYYVPQIDFSDKLTGTYLEFTTDTRTVSRGPKKFTTKSAAQEYIDNNKPKYSLADIENCYPHANITGNRIKDIPVVAALFSNLKKLGK